MTDLNTTENEEFSLADLADIDVSQIAEVRYENLPQGSYDFEITESGLAEDTDKEGAKRFKAAISMKVLAVRAVLAPNVDKDRLVGKVHNEAFFIHPGKSSEDVQAAIGRVRAFVTDVGMDSSGKLGDIVTNLKGHRFIGKIVEQKDKTDSSIVYARLKLESKAK